MELKSPSSSLSWILGNFLSFLTLLLGRAAAQDEWLCYTHVHFHLCYKVLSFLWKLNCLSVSPFFVSLAEKHWNDNEKQVVRAFNSWIRLHALFKNGFTFAIQCNGNSTIWNRAHDVRSYLKKSETSHQRHRKQWTVNISVSFHQNSWNFVSKISYFSDFVMRNKTQRVN